jgi:Family of unknown function (DUF5317)
VLIGVVMLVAIASVPLTGGRLGALAEIRLRHTWAILTALAAQIVITTIVPDGSASLHAGLHLGTYAVAAIFVVANRRLPGLWLLALGAGLNLLVIAVNGGVMPADPDALERAGLPVVSGEFENSTVLEDPKLPVLGDVFAVPEPLPFANVFSVGDILLVLGGLVALHRSCGSRLVPGAFHRLDSTNRARPKNHRTDAVGTPGSATDEGTNGPPTRS